MARPRLDPNEDGGLAALRGLQRGGVFETVRGHNPIIVIGRRDECRGVFRARLDVVQRRVSVERCKLIRIVR